MIAGLGTYRHLLGLCLGIFLSVVCLAQTKPRAISNMDSLMEQQAKPILILLSTDWCIYCQMQKKQIRKNKDFLEKADLFYYVIFNAESTETVRFHQQDYAFKPTGNNTGTHELAHALNGRGPLAYPTWVLLDKNYQVLFRHAGVLAPDQLKELLDAMEKM